ncbi:MAG: amidase [Myxococcales bacterium]|nr:amidase [Myxococcales bacterium]
MTPSIHDLSALELARRIRAGELASVELVTHYLERIAARDPELGAFVDVHAERALADARARDRAGAGRWLAPFHGVPTAIKDLHAIRGTRARMGSRAYRWLWTPHDDLTVRAIRRAGFVILGKTSTSELGLLPVVETDLHPPTRNAWNAAHTAGGSSGGAGAAVGAGLVPVAPGSDGAGSVRIPAALNGLFGFKPSRGAIPNPYEASDRLKMTTIGPLARDVADGLALLDVLDGRDPRGRNSYSTRCSVRPSRLRVGWLTDAPVATTDPAIGAAVESAVSALSAAGHATQRLAPIAGELDEFMPLYQYLLAGAPVFTPWKLQPTTRWFRAEGKRQDPAVMRSRALELSARAMAPLDAVDVMVTPTVAVRTPRVNETRHLPPEAMFRALAPLGAFTATANLAGAPAATVPWAIVDGDLPVGVQIVGRPGADELVLQLAHELESLRAVSFGVARRHAGPTA